MNRMKVGARFYGRICEKFQPLTKGEKAKILKYYLHRSLTRTQYVSQNSTLVFVLSLEFQKKI